MIIESLILGGSFLIGIIYLSETLSTSLEDEKLYYPHTDVNYEDEVPEEVANPSNEEYGSEQMHRFQKEFDERINMMRSDLGLPPLPTDKQKNMPGILFDEDHSLVDSKYVLIPEEEVAK